MEERDFKEYFIMENEGTKADTKARNIFELVLVIVLTIFNMLLTLNG